VSERGQEDADTAAAEHWRYATVVLSLSPTTAPPSASFLSEATMKILYTGHNHHCLLRAPMTNMLS